MGACRQAYLIMCCRAWHAQTGEFLGKLSKSDFLEVIVRAYCHVIASSSGEEFLVIPVGSSTRSITVISVRPRRRSELLEPWVTSLHSAPGYSATRGYTTRRVCMDAGLRKRRCIGTASELETPCTSNCELGASPSVNRCAEQLRRIVD